LPRSGNTVQNSVIYTTKHSTADAFSLVTWS
jgi:hypothetical protein